MADREPDQHSLLEGLLESLITEELERRLRTADALNAHIGAVDPADEPHVLARHLARVVEAELTRRRNPDDRRDIVNDLLDHLDAPDERLTGQSRQLLSLVRPAAPGVLARSTTRPATPLSDAALLTNGHGEPSIGAEVRAELASADEVDVVLAFVMWHGLRLLERELTELRDRGIPLRVITTTYVGATEREALDRLVRDFGAHVKVHYDTQRTRLHAKAWLFRRNTGFDTAYVGSSNLSRSALLDGVEWNVRLSSVATPALLSKFRATFDSYWHDSAYETYHPDRDGDRLDDALVQARGGHPSGRVTLTLSGLEVRPYAHQAEMLEQLDVERRVHDRHANLLVAATGTGTGKTVVAALDYRRLASAAGERPTLLFVAHRKEILEQSLRTYREVLGDAGFGELYVAGLRPERWQHVFASVQSLTSYGVHRIPADAFAIVVIDEFHHAEATTYRRLTDHLTPRELLGLTATPERGDGRDVRQFFGGRTAAELRLWDALGGDLLTPFHYFGIADGTDLRRIDWKAGAYDTTALSDVFTGNDARARMVLQAVRDKIARPDRMKSLGFCVDTRHATYMAQVFTDAGLPSTTVLGTTSMSERERAIEDLRAGRIVAVFTVDVFNEGVDIPQIDTVLFLRPTESATVFLQQLGRGLRLAPDKAVLTALDFVGHHRAEFRFDRRYRALTGSTRAQLQRDVEHGFPFLPSGTQIVLDRQSQALVLANIRGQVTTRWAHISAELRAHPTQDLPTFLAQSEVELADVIAKPGRSWARLRREASMAVPAAGPHEAGLHKRVRALAHVDDPDRARSYLRWLADDAPAYDQADPTDQALFRMLAFSLWPDGGGSTTYQQMLDVLRHEPAAREDLRAVISLGLQGAQHVTAPLRGPLGQRPLRVHARYTREEVVAALDYVSIEGRKANSFREGVLFAQEADADAFLVTLKKSEADYSPTTMYQDYAISPELFHWESQSVTTAASPTGQRYIHHRGRNTHVLLFARGTKTTELGAGAPYLFLGDADYVSHRGEKPMAITWRLRTPMPISAFEVAKVVA